MGTITEEVEKGHRLFLRSLAIMKIGAESPV